MALRDIFEAHGVEYEYRYLDGRRAAVAVEPIDEAHGDVARSDGTEAAAAPV
jgi:hypothetical protein